MDADEHGERAGDADPDVERPCTLAGKLDRLFRDMAPKGKPFSYQAVADAINAKSGETGVTMSHATIWELRTGKRSDPRLSQLQALADFFGVPVGYFTDDSVAQKVDKDLDLLRAMRDSEVRVIATRASELSPAGLRAVSAMIDAMKGLEDESGKADG